MAVLGVSAIWSVFLAGVAPRVVLGARVGLSDQRSLFFGDPRFRALGISTARLVVPWNEGLRPEPTVEDWLALAAKDGIEPVIAFERARGETCPAAPCMLPTMSQYATAFRAFHRQHPEVRLFTAWNEPNQPGQPTAPDPAAAAGFYNTLVRLCPGCTILAGDMLDAPGMDVWLAAYRAALDVIPAVWGLHDYYDATNFQTDGVDTLLNTVPGEVWLTETGGIVQFAPASGGRATYDPDRAANSIRFVLETVAARSRVTRAYFYQWQKTSPGDAFDAGLLDPGVGGAARPGYYVLRDALPRPPAGAAGGVSAVVPSASAADGVSVSTDVRRRLPTGRIRGIGVHLIAHAAIEIDFRCPGGEACRGRIRVASKGWRALELAGRRRPSARALLPPESRPYDVAPRARGVLRLPVPRALQEATRRGMRLTLTLTVVESQGVDILTRRV